MNEIKPEQEREALRRYIDDNIMMSGEVVEVLGFSRERLKQLVHEGRIKTVRTGLYLKDDILAFKKERERK